MWGLFDQTITKPQTQKEEKLEERFYMNDILGFFLGQSLGMDDTINI